MCSPEDVSIVLLSDHMNSMDGVGGSGPAISVENVSSSPFRFICHSLVSSGPEP